jgi:hypothetical protein
MLWSESCLLMGVSDAETAFPTDLFSLGPAVNILEKGIL